MSLYNYGGLLWPQIYPFIKLDWHWNHSGQSVSNISKTSGIEMCWDRALTGSRWFLTFWPCCTQFLGFNIPSHPKPIWCQWPLNSWRAECFPGLIHTVQNMQHLGGTTHKWHFGSLIYLHGRREKKGNNNRVMKHDSSTEHGNGYIGGFDRIIQF